MSESNAIYPIIITVDKGKDSKTPSYLVEIPAINGMTEGYSVADAISMAQDYIGTYSLENKLPKSVTTLPKAKNDQIVTLVSVDVAEYKRKHDNRIIKKTVTLPSYLNELGKEKGVNFSALLVNALKNELQVD